jgi:hypothetical protein
VSTTVTVLVGVLAFVGGTASALGGSLIQARKAGQDTSQRETQSRREEWWRRFRWAVELTANEDPERRTVGFAVLGELVRSPLASDDERRIVVAVTDPVLAGYRRRVERQQEPNSDER